MLSVRVPFVALVGLTVFLAGFTPDAISTDSIMIAGVGADTCGAYLGNREKYDHGSLQEGTYGLAVTSWVHGFRTGQNSIRAAQSRPQRTDALDRATILAYFDKYCRDHPLLAVLGAVTCMLAESGNENCHLLHEVMASCTNGTPRASGVSSGLLRLGQPILTCLGSCNDLSWLSF